MLPTPELVRPYCVHLSATDDLSNQVGKLNVYRNVPVEELVRLEGADRFLVECIKIYRIEDRVKAMLYRARFLENIKLHEEVDRIVLVRANSADASLLHSSSLRRSLMLPRTFSTLRSSPSYSRCVCSWTAFIGSS